MWILRLARPPPSERTSVISGHGRQHSIMPSEVNYRANIWALKEEGCTHVIVTTACGSLREEIRPGDIVIIDQFIDSCFVQMRVQRRSTHYTCELINKPFRKVWTFLPPFFLFVL
uniref:Nucleoside phosphorylase domain-containing protein n=1 Tax=Equus caballus TaxID=9796 RepID=A0A9L0RWA5_HORSE